MAKLSSDGTYVTVESGDTLSQIAVNHGGGKTYKQLAAINSIQNPDLIYVGQKIYLNTPGTSAVSASGAVISRATITAFGLQSNSGSTLFATWTWPLSNTESYKVQWSYETGDGVWFIGSNTSITVDKDDPAASRQSTYSIPSNAKRVHFKVKPISEAKNKNSSSNPTYYWTATWSTVKTYSVSQTPPITPGAPNVTLDKYKLTATLDGLEDAYASDVQFQIVRDNSYNFHSGKAKIITGHASYSCTVAAGSEYKVRCRSFRGSEYSEWSGYSANVKTIPSVPSEITTIKANSETSVYLEWPAVTSATSYDIEYATKKEYFDGSDSTTTTSGIEFTHYEKTGLETGTEYFFRVRAVNSAGHSAWSEIKSVAIGDDPAAPTTWSSTTTAVVGEPLTLYWVHNSADGSSQTYGELELDIDGSLETHTIKNSTDKDEKDKTSSYAVDTSKYADGAKIQWRVRTAGVTNKYGEWSIQRTIDIYAPPTLELRVTDLSEESVEILESFPFYVYGLAGPNTQRPTGYHLVVTANDPYETYDEIGNAAVVNAGDQVYSKYFDTSDTLFVEMSAGNIDLHNNIDYTITCIASMSSGLTAEASIQFTVSWTELLYEPNAEIGVDEETYMASIRPYYEKFTMAYFKVDSTPTGFYKTNEIIDSVYGEPSGGNLKTSTGEAVYQGVTSEGESVLYCISEYKKEVSDSEDVVLSVYRREYDGKFTELASDIEASSNTYITDPHPALDYARYRIVAKSKTTGSVNYYDVPGYYVGGKSVIIQWSEDWTNFDTTEDNEPERPSWSGSMLKLPYNIDISDDHNPDTALIEYVGREHPVSYYGTQRGVTSSWNVVIAKDDKETLYALRRLAAWMGDVYVREPSGSGYWANITVSFGQKHRNQTIPVTFSVKRVEGGV